ncbi:MAG: CxxC-x17-CxxC domain-containing protein [Patescibacteria group bacterium]
MDKFQKGGFRQGGGNSGGNPRFGNKFGGGWDRGNRPGGRMELFPAVCSECRKNCEVPFRPTGDKPVYCRDCFGKQPHVPGRNSNGSDRPREDFRRDVQPQREYQPEPARVPSGGAIDALRRQIASLEVKVNRVLELLSQKAAASDLRATIIEEAPKVTKETKIKTTARKAGKKTKK